MSLAIVKPAGELTSLIVKEKADNTIDFGFTGNSEMLARMLSQVMLKNPYVAAAVTTAVVYAAREIGVHPHQLIVTQ